MKRMIVACLVALALPLAASAARPKAAPAAKRDWTTVVTPTAQGSYVLGNPAATVKLVEYFSFTCSHCAHFAGEGYPALKQRYIASGKVSLELRNAVRDRFDLTAALLSRCQGGRGVFPATELLMAQQSAWLERGMAFEEAERSRLQGLPPAELLPVIADGAGLAALMRTRGLSPAAAKQCLADQAAVERLGAMANEAWRDRRIPGTPAFMINGAIVEGASSWDRLEPAIAEALK